MKTGIYLLPYIAGKLLQEVDRTNGLRLMIFSFERHFGVGCICCDCRKYIRKTLRYGNFSCISPYRVILYTIKMEILFLLPIKSIIGYFLVNKIRFSSYSTKKVSKNDT
jgi:hypothetical protein